MWSKSTQKLTFGLERDKGFSFIRNREYIKRKFMSDWWDLFVVCYDLLNDNLGTKWKNLNPKRKIKNDGNRILHEAVKELLLNLPSKNISNFWTTTKHWKSLTNDNEFWKTMCEKEHFNKSAINPKSKLYSKLLTKYPFQQQALYIYNKMIRDNWSNDNFTTIKVGYHLHQIHHFDDEEIIATSCTDLFILSSSTGMAKHIFAIPDNFLIQVVKNENFLLAYFGSGTFLIFDRNKRRSSNFTVDSANNIKENSIQLHGNLIFFITFSGDFKVFSIKNNAIEYEQAGVTWACAHQDMIILGTTNESTQIFDLNYNALRIQNCCEGKTTLKIEMVSEYLINLCVGIDDIARCDICVWDIQTETKLASITGMSSSSVTVLDNNKIACRKLDETETEMFEVWSFLTGERLFTIDDSDNRPITSITSNHHFIFTVSANSNSIKYIKLWCPKTGKFLKLLKLETDFWCDTFCKPTDTKFVYLRRSPNCLSKSLCIVDYDNEERKEK